MDLHKLKKILILLSATYLALVVMIYFAAGNALRYQVLTGDQITPSAVVGEITDGIVLEQRLCPTTSRVTTVCIQAATFSRENTGTLHICFLASDGSELSEQTVDVSTMQDNAELRIELDRPIVGYKDKDITLRITSEGAIPGKAVTLYYGTGKQSGRLNLTGQLSDSDLYRIDGVAGTGMLCAYLIGVNEFAVYRLYWPGAITLYLLSAALCGFWWKREKRGKTTPLTSLYMLTVRYGFLMRQLVARDFKTKYKRSVLGIGWSILNPLLTMLVQYVVFSTLFSAGTRNYPVYLLTGIVFFNFFNESITMGMTSITNNAQLIKKVYMPKYIYPVSRVLSSLINLGTSMIPLIFVMLLTGIRPSLSMLLLIFDILCLIVFVIGMSLLMATFMTFFQDTLFLWGIISMIWMYLTPIFYMDNIIPEQYIRLYHCNPLYQYVSFARICIIDGTSPAPPTYLWCLLSSCIVLVIGLFVFKRNENRFALYL